MCRNTGAGKVRQCALLTTALENRIAANQYISKILFKRSEVLRNFVEKFPLFAERLEISQLTTLAVSNK